jgi:enoyl-CoA hydratase/carnithine racemase
MTDIEDRRVYTIGDVTIEMGPDGVATVMMHRPPANFFDAELMRELVAAVKLAGTQAARSVVLCSEGKHFCAGANFARSRGEQELLSRLYEQGVELFRQPLPIVAAVQGRAVGGGAGLALAADFRVATPATRFQANFSRLGLHHGFGLSITLPAVVGQQLAWDMLLTGREVTTEEMTASGLCDRMVPEGELYGEAHRLAAEIAAAAPLAVRSIRRTMRGDLADRVAESCRDELEQQQLLSKSQDFREGVRAARDRRAPQFHGI